MWDFNNVLFISGCLGDTQRYRVFNQIEQLTLNRVQAEEVYFENPELISRINSAKIIILHRVPHTPLIELAVSLAKNRNKFVFFDVDDLVYDIDMAKFADGLNYLTPDERNLFFEKVERHQKTMLLCDGVIVSTRFLFNTVSRYLNNVVINRNALSQELIKISEEVNKKYPPENEDAVIIGYFSGTRTHNKDFLEVKDTLLEVLSEYTNVKLCIGGLLDLPSEFDKLSSRIIRFPLVDWRNLPENIKKVDINLAPLELNNPFCRAKSELKYFEAAILKVPTIASDIDAFQIAIKNGENGYLCKTKDDWKKTLKLLINDAALRKKIAENAYNHTLTNYNPLSRGKQLIESLGILIDNTKTNQGKNIQDMSNIKVTGSETEMFNLLMELFKRLQERERIEEYLLSEIDRLKAAAEQHQIFIGKIRGSVPVLLYKKIKNLGFVKPIKNLVRRIFGRINL